MRSAPNWEDDKAQEKSLRLSMAGLQLWNVLPAANTMAKRKQRTFPTYIAMSACAPSR